jgi:hypothetical protein
MFFDLWASLLTPLLFLQLHAVTSCLESVFLVVILTIWLWCGVRLQMHVMEVSFRPEAERRILFTINIVMAAILLSNLLRAIMILTLFLEEDFKIHLSYSFLCWVVGTRWIPYVFCSALLIMIMQRSFDTLGPATSLSGDKQGGSNDAESDGRRFRASQRQFGHSSSGGNRNSMLHAAAAASLMTDQCSEDRSSLLSRDSFALYVADYGNDSHSFASPIGSFSNLSNAELEGPGTPMVLASIAEEEDISYRPTVPRPPAAPRVISTSLPAVCTTGGTATSVVHTENVSSVGVGGVVAFRPETIMSLCSLEAYTDDSFVNEDLLGVSSKDLLTRPLLRRELSVTSESIIPYRADRKCSI